MATFKVNDRQTLLNVHTKDQCQQPCVIHAPLDGPWRNWSLMWRPVNEYDELFGMYRGFERMCPCGVGHPAAEEYFRRNRDQLRHGCCGIHDCMPGAMLEES